MWEAVTVYVTTLAFVAYVMWFNRARGTVDKQIQDLRNEMAQLALAVGLRNRNAAQQGPRPMGSPIP